MKRAKVTGKVRKERIEKNLLRGRGCGGFVQCFIAERELLQSTGHLVGQHREIPCVHCSSSGTQLHLAEDTPETPVQQGEKKTKKLRICRDISNSCRTPVWLCAYSQRSPTRKQDSRNQQLLCLVPLISLDECVIFSPWTLAIQSLGN